MNAKEIRAWVGLIIGVVGIPSALGYLLSDRAVVGVLTGLIVVGILGIALWIRWYRAQPPYIVEDLEKELILHSPDGSQATFSRTIRVKSKQAALHQVTTGSISVTGRVENICMDDRPVQEDPDAVLGEEGKDLYVTKFLRPPLGRDQVTTIKMSYDLLDSFPKSTEGLTHRVAHSTQEVRSKIRYPKERPCLSARAILRYAGEIHKRLSDPEITNRGTRLDFKVTKPGLGQEYRIEWDW
jgi:hypothetical protein